MTDIALKNADGAFRFAYFTDKYKETCQFYQYKLGFQLEYS